MKFIGGYTKLQKCISKTGISGKWREIENHQMQYRTDDDAVLNWWEATGTVTFQGRKVAVGILKRSFVRVALKKNRLEVEGTPVDEIADLRRQLKESAESYSVAPDQRSRLGEANIIVRYAPMSDRIVRCREKSRWATRVTSHCGKALGIIFPLTLLGRADEVIE